VAVAVEIRLGTRISRRELHVTGTPSGSVVQVRAVPCDAENLPTSSGGCERFGRDQARSSRPAALLGCKAGYLRPTRREAHEHN
jgi:hypothetical protein